MSKRKAYPTTLVSLFCLTTWFHVNDISATTIEDLSASVVFLHDSEAPPYNKSATGFLVADGGKPFLVTASHVATEMNSTCFGTIRMEGDKPFTFKLSELVAGGGKFEWKSHKEADVAVISLRPEQNFFKNHLQYHFLDISWFENKTVAPARAKTLTVLGFPLELGTEGSFSPLSRETKASSGLLVMNRGDTKTPATFFITQDPSIGGFSGAPVFDLGLPYSENGTFTLQPSNIRILGLVHGTLSDNTGGKLGAVVPAAYICELLKGI